MTFKLLIRVLAAAAVLLVSRRLLALHGPSATLEANVYIETLGDTATPVLLEGYDVPATREETFNTAHDEQTSIDMHLLCGHSDKASENRTLGRWRVTDIPPQPKGQAQIRMRVHIDEAGTVTVAAALDARQLTVTVLTDSVAAVPTGPR